jgi:hypothetical protein
LLLSPTLKESSSSPIAILRWENAESGKLLLFFHSTAPLFFFSFPFGVVYFSTDVLAALHFVSVTSIHVQASFVFLAFFSHDPSTSIHPRNPPTREEVQSSLLARSRPVRVSRVTPSKKLGYSKK